MRGLGQVQSDVTGTIVADRAATKAMVQGSAVINSALPAKRSRLKSGGIYIAGGDFAGAKIAALGLKIRNGCSYHGVSLNVSMNLAPFADINPCGYVGLRTVDMASLDVAASWHDVAKQLADRLIHNLAPTFYPQAAVSGDRLDF